MKFSNIFFGYVTLLPMRYAAQDDNKLRAEIKNIVSSLVERQLFDFGEKMAQKLDEKIK